MDSSGTIHSLHEKRYLTHAPRLHDQGVDGKGHNRSAVSLPDPKTVMLGYKQRRIISNVL